MALDILNLGGDSEDDNTLLGGILDPILGGDGGLLGGDDGLLGNGGLLGGDLLDGLPILGGGDDGGGDLLGGLPILGDTIDLDGLLGDINLDDLLSGGGLLGAIGDGSADDGILEQLLNGLGLVEVDGLVGDLLDSPGDPGVVRNLLDPLLGDEDDGLLDDVLDLLLGEDDGSNTPPEGVPPPDPEDFDNVIIGTEGRDSLAIDVGESTFVDGLGELDTVTVSQNSSDFNYIAGSDGIYFIDATSDAEDPTTNYFTNVERVSFLDAKIALDVELGENAGLAYRLYNATFDRVPDAQGLRFWIDALDAGASQAEVGFGFAESIEFRSTYGELDNEEFVAQLYENILDRTAEQEGQEFWVGELNGGAERGTVLALISESPENFQNFVEENATNGDFIFIG